FPKSPMEFNVDIDWNTVMEVQTLDLDGLVRYIYKLLNKFDEISKRNIKLDIIHQIPPEDLCEMSDNYNRSKFSDYVVKQIKIFLAIQMYSIFVTPSFLNKFKEYKKFMRTVVNKFIT